MNKKAIVIGYSGHTYVLVDILLDNRMDILGYCEIAKKSNNPYRLQYIGDESDDKLISKLRSSWCYLGIGDNQLREKIYKTLVDKNILMPLLCHKSAVISNTVVLGNATVVMPGAIINAMVNIGNAVICNSASVIEHECQIGDYTHIAPGAVLAGNVSVGAGCFIGANSVIKQGIKLGSNVTVGAGSVVVKDIPDNSVIYGNPAKAK